MAWLIAAVLVFIAEMFVGTMYLMILSAALAGAGLVSMLYGGGWTVPLVTAALLSAVGLLWLNSYLKTHKSKQDETSNDLDIGHPVQILKHLHGDMYQVSYRGSFWQARALNAAAVPQPQSAVITGKDGNTLLIQLH